jgi:hypothetical protein
LIVNVLPWGNAEQTGRLRATRPFVMFLDTWKIFTLTDYVYQIFSACPIVCNRLYESEFVDCIRICLADDAGIR